MKAFAILLAVLMPAVIMSSQEAAWLNAQIDANKVVLAQYSEITPGETAAKITTDAGEIVVRLFAKHTPQTVNDFKHLAENGFYNGQPFSAVVGHKIETAVPAAATAASFSENEYTLALWHFRGAVSLADKSGTFMIVTAVNSLNPIEKLNEINFPVKVVDQYEESGGAPHQDWKNTVFGHVIKGMDVADAIIRGKTASGGTLSAPAVIQKIEIIAL